METGNNVLVYNVTIKTDQGEVERKAMDIVNLKQFIEDNKARFNVFNMDISSIDQDDKVYPYIARAAMSIIEEIESSIDEALGLKKEEPEEKPEEPEVEKVTPPQNPVKQQPTYSAKQENNRIVL